MELQQAHLSAQTYCYYPYNFYQPSLFNSGFNFFLFPHTDKNAFNSSFISSPTEAPTPQYSLLPAENHQFSSKRRENTVIQRTSNLEEDIESKRSSTKMSEQKPKRRLSHMQKENRNVASNLLRIFFKNILEVSAYDGVIADIVRKHRIEHSVEDFINWLEKFKINFKNYIKPT